MPDSNSGLFLRQRSRAYLSLTRRKLWTRCALVPCLSRPTRLCSTGHRCLEANTGFFVKAPTDGPVSRLFPVIRYDEPGCFDCWIQDSLAGRTPRVDRVGIAYMYIGAWVKSSKASFGLEFHVGPHLMVVSPHQDDFQGFNRDGLNGMPYVTHLPGRTELYLVMPIRQWGEK
jgi:hypothetical protein